MKIFLFQGHWIRVTSQLKSCNTPFLIGVHYMAHNQSNSYFVQLVLVFCIEFMLQSLYAFFAHNPKKFLEFSKLVKTLETKRLKLLRNVQTHWISMLSPLKCVQDQYKSLIVKMCSNCEKNKYSPDNFELLCDLDLILGLPCVMPILKAIHSFIKYAQCRNVFIMDFLHVINLVKIEFFPSILIHFPILMIHCLMISPNYCWSNGAQIWLNPKLFLVLILMDISLLSTFGT
jgi:hypothetical protein